MISITRINNIFHGDRETWYQPEGGLVSSYLPCDFDCQTGIVELNGKHLEEYDIAANENDNLVIVDLPSGPLVSGAAMLIYAALTGPAWIAIPTAMALSIGVSLGLSFLMRPSIPQLDEQEADFPEFTGVQTTIGSRPIPIVFGEVRCGGHIIESFTDPKYTVRPETDTDSETIVIDETALQAPELRALNTRIAYCWGPIESISNIEIDDNAVENIPGLIYEPRLGTYFQQSMFGSEESATNYAEPGGVIVEASPETNTTSTEVDAAAIKLVFSSGLYEWTGNQFKNREVEIDIEYRISGGSWQDFKDGLMLSGSSIGPLPVWIRLPNFGTRDIYEIRVTRVTPDNVDPDIKDEFEWTVTKEIRRGVYAHPGIAQVMFEQVPQERAGVPKKYTAVIKGLNDIRVYSDTATYTEQWTDNPVWIALHFICHKRFGLGMFYDYEDVESMQDWIDAAAWCDALVEDGNGGYETRCAFNYELRDQIAAPEFLRRIADTCGLFFIEQAGKWRIVVDDNDEMVQVFSEGNYKRDSLTWSFVNTYNRATRLTGIFRNSARDYDTDSITATEQTLPAYTNQYIEGTVNFHGVTNSNQVFRELHKQLNAGRLNYNAVKFTTGFAARNLKVGNIFGLATLTGAVGVANGRVERVSANRQTIWFDSEVEWDSAETYDITVCHQSTNLIDKVSYSPARTHTANVITLNSVNWKEGPMPGDVYAVGLENYSIQKFRCIQTKLNDDHTIEVSALSHDPDVYKTDYVTETEPEKKYYYSNRQPPPVSSMTGFQKYWYSTFWTCELAWVIDEDAIYNGATISHYEVYYHETASDAWRLAGTTKAQRFNVLFLEAGTEYIFTAIAVGPTGAAISLADAPTVTKTMS